MGDVAAVAVGLLIVVAVLGFFVNGATMRHRYAQDRKLAERLDMMAEAEATRRAYRVRQGLD